MSGSSFFVSWLIDLSFDTVVMFFALLLACAVAFERLVLNGELQTSPLGKHVAAVSCGVYQDTPVLDLCYIEDRDARVDFNIVMTEDKEFVELQGSGEEAAFSEDEMAAMLALGKKGITEIGELQRTAVAEALGEADKDAAERLADFFSGEKPLQA